MQGKHGSWLGVGYVWLVTVSGQQTSWKERLKPISTEHWWLCPLDGTTLTVLPDQRHFSVCTLISHKLLSTKQTVITELSIDLANNQYFYWGILTDATSPCITQFGAVTTPATMLNTLGLFYGNIPNAFTSKHHPPFGHSDHNVILLLPKYRS